MSTKAKKVRKTAVLCLVTLSLAQALEPHAADADDLDPPRLSLKDMQVTGHRIRMPLTAADIDKFEAIQSQLGRREYAKRTSLFVRAFESLRSLPAGSPDRARIVQFLGKTLVPAAGSSGEDAIHALTDLTKIGNDGRIGEEVVPLLLKATRNTAFPDGQEFALSMLKTFPDHPEVKAMVSELKGSLDSALKGDGRGSAETLRKLKFVSPAEQAAYIQANLPALLDRNDLAELRLDDEIASVIEKEKLLIPQAEINRMLPSLPALSDLARVMADRVSDPVASFCPKETRFDSPGGSLEHAGVVDQDGLGICYSSSSSMAMSAITAIEGKPARISQFATALQNTRARGWESVMDAAGRMQAIEGGHFCAAFETMMMDGACPREGFDELFTTQDSYRKAQAALRATGGNSLVQLRSTAGAAPDESPREMLQYLQSIFNTTYGKLAGEISDAIASGKPQKEVDQLIARAAGDGARDAQKAGSEYVCKRSGHVLDAPEDLRPLISSLRRNEASGFVFRMLAAKGCGHGKRIQPAKPYVCTAKSVTEQSAKTVMLQALAHLGQGNRGIPIGIAYNADVLKVDPSSRAALTSPLRHSSVLIGSRPSPSGKGCQVLLRNSWGTTCAPPNYHPAHQANCKDGQIWIDAETLFRPGVTDQIERVSEDKT